MWQVSLRARASKKETQNNFKIKNYFEAKNETKLDNQMVSIKDPEAALKPYLIYYKLFIMLRTKY